MKRLLVSVIISLSCLPLAVDAIYTNTNISSTNSLKFDAEVAQARMGSSSVAVGDVNNDGYDDWLLAAYDDSSSRDDAYLVYGNATHATTVGSFSLSATSVAQFLGTTSEGYNGSIVGAAGDVDGDGYDDFLIGAPFQSSVKGQVYLIYGQATAFSASQTASATGITFTGETAGDYLGYALGSADINNDGYSDILIGSRNNSSGKGALYIIYGQASRFTSVAITAVMDAKFQGETANDNFGSVLANAGDVNNDGYDDILAGAPRYSTYTGGAYLIYGRAADFSGTNTISTSNSMLFYGQQTYDGVGASLASAGDVDGDGYNDFLIGASEQATGDTIADGAFIVYGQAAAFSSTTNVGTLPKFTTETSSDDVRYTVAGGDVNNDGYSDVVIGLPHQSSSAGAVYIFLGSTTRFTSTSVTNANYRLLGSISSGSFGSAAAVLNNNNDNALDLLVGSSGDSSVFTNGGSSLVIRLFIDNDDDGVASSAGLVAGTDCSDIDATVSSNQTYYQDSDGDGYGSTTTTSSCTSTPPVGYVINDDDCNDADGTVYTEQTYYTDADGDGLGVVGSSMLSCTATAPTNYADNDDDTDDTIKNNGVEIDGDSTDNDGDGSIDEVNTLTENGAHPEFGDDDVTDGDVYSADVSAVVGTTNGDVLVTYADNSVYQYDVLAITSSKITKVHVHPDSGLVVVVHPKARSMVLLNSLSGEEHSQKQLNAKSHQKVKTFLKDIRNDGTYELVVAAKRNPKTIHVHIVTVKVNSLILQKRINISRTYKQVVVAKTKVKRTSIQLRTQRSKVVESFTVKKNYSLAD